MVDFPNYLNPPVIEVAIGVQFTPIVDLCAAHLGLFWKTIDDVFTHVEEQPPIAHRIERPEGQFGNPMPSLHISQKPDLPRTWFIDTPGNQIIQIQADRFLHNWRKISETDAYPRFPKVKTNFLKYWSKFCSFLKDRSLPLPQLDQCELTYVNHIKKGNGWNSFLDLSQVFTTFAWRTRSDFLPPPETVNWSMRFPLPGQKGRLYVEIIPVVIPQENSLAIRFSLTARGKPDGEINNENLPIWFDSAREWIVKGFADLVDKKTDALWEKQV